MGKRDEQRKIKLCILNKIKKHKDLLFSPANRKLKAEKWHEINKYAQYLGAIDSNRDVCYVRDVWWPNAKKCTMDRFEKSGTDTSKDKVLTPVDIEVLSIMGQVSVYGDVPGSMEKVEEDDLPEEDIPEDLPNGIELSRQSNKIIDYKWMCEQRCPKDDLDEIRMLKKECLKAQLYKFKLEARKLEIELGMPPSGITCDIQTHTEIPFSSSNE